MPVSAPTQLHLAYRGIQQRLQVVFPEDRFQHIFVPPKMDARAWAGITTKVPAVGIGWDAIEAKKSNGRLFEGPLTWTVFLIARNQGGVAQRFLGDAQGIGLFHMIAAAVATLSGHTIADVGTVEVMSVQNVVSNEWDMASDVLATLGLSIPTAFTPFAVLDDLEPSGLLKTLGIDWDVAPDEPTVIEPVGIAA